MTVNYKKGSAVYPKEKDVVMTQKDEFGGHSWCIKQKGKTVLSVITKTEKLEEESLQSE
jgi:hypothetical protein